ncbi:MAG TPA: hypothetical protein H9836_16560 [Candidatus Nocardiopsis merdipullorum]|nr:hypothetical protein [Candidatus Nocardiopsis merdipullorum]
MPVRPGDISLLRKEQEGKTLRHGKALLPHQYWRKRNATSIDGLPGLRFADGSV